MLAHSRAKIYALVSDVAGYPEFIDHCESVACLSRDNDQAGLTHERWQLVFRYYGWPIKVVMHNQSSQDAWITTELESGPIESLKGQWQFESISEEVTQVSLELMIDLGNGWLSALASDWLLDSYCEQVLQNFKSRAKKVG